ncbi:DUF1152 domain-containing protein [Streptomyces hoynatensis]|uniref:DUF1152 domain-containing protein n=1 Tax=Streptomyces hoynatensis TaxID=1141874 RepID=A0A3A9YSN6_9ACTN|nr:DUF1152 domain-containing protein [Streptomyces hoynatensis]RKN38990.1 DUF1152 domain-containing protein [Streptomyces hoynatensis]
MKRLLIAAGGGGDAIATAMVHAALHGAGTEALVLTYAWERLVVDPVPGPRRPSDFSGTLRPTPRLHLVTPASAPLPPAGSLLPRLAADLRPELGLLDPYEGTVGLARQIAEAAAYCAADRVEIVDVGGDALAEGDEPTLRSPLGDALVLAACARAGLPASVLIAGPGLDNEVPEARLRPRLGAPAFTLTAGDTACVDRVFAWHPSEASALLVAAARGVRGVCGTRDAPRPLTLGPGSAAVHRLTLPAALAVNRLARALEGAASLGEAEEASRAVCGFSEIARERERALDLAARGGARPGAGRNPEPAALDAEFAAWERRTAATGVEYVTTRRIAEELGLSRPALTGLLGRLRAAAPPRHAPPLWRLCPGPPSAGRPLG